MWGSLALLWRQISSKAFPPSAINPPSHLPSALHLVHFCCHSDYFLSIPFPLHSQCITIALPACSQFLPATCSLFSYPVSPCCSTLQSSPSPNYAFFLKFSFANLHFNFASSFHCSKLPFFSPSLLLLSSSQLWPLLFSGTGSLTPYLPNALKGAGAGNTPAPRAQSCTAAARGTTIGSSDQPRAGEKPQDSQSC